MSRLKPSFDPKSFLSRIEGGVTHARMHAQQTVYSQGDPADSVFYILEGQIELKVLSKRGKEAVLGLIGGSSFFGEGCLTGQSLRLATATSITESVVARVEKAAMVRVIHDEQAFSEMFVSYLLTRNNRIEEDLIDQLFNSSEKRLARLLLLLSNFGKEAASEAIIPDISQETLANMIGTTRPRVSVFMNKFRKMGLIEYNGHLRVHSSLLSMILRDDEKS